LGIFVETVTQQAWFLFLIFVELNLQVQKLASFSVESGLIWA